MATPSNFVPVITVFSEYISAPCLWLLSSPDEYGVGQNIYDDGEWSASLPMTFELWQKFMDWAIDFANKEIILDEPLTVRWDWNAFHERGLQLSRCLKQELGNAYRVVYLKSGEDPDSQIEKRREILADGRLIELPYLRRVVSEE
jgi:hypothetical protein